jgi:hypothetical protein
MRMRGMKEVSVPVTHSRCDFDLDEFKKTRQKDKIFGLQLKGKFGEKNAKHMLRN